MDTPFPVFIDIRRDEREGNEKVKLELNNKSMIKGLDLIIFIHCDDWKLNFFKFIDRTKHQKISAKCRYNISRAN